MRNERMDTRQFGEKAGGPSWKGSKRANATRVVQVCGVPWTLSLDTTGGNLGCWVGDWQWQLLRQILVVRLGIRWQPDAVPCVSGQLVFFIDPVPIVIGLRSYSATTLINIKSSGDIIPCLSGVIYGRNGAECRM